MLHSTERILEDLGTVARERALRARDAGLLTRVHALKAYQQRRFELTYADLLAAPRYQPAARFFLEELYGPHDFATRDEQFARVVPALTRLFPGSVVDTVQALAALHALSESLDSAMARTLVDDRLTRERYVAAWQATGRAADRERQIVLTLAVGESLDRLTRHPLLRRSLRAMRAPARAAGLAQLQHFLEDGFDAFREMRGASAFLASIGHRERALAAALFAADAQAAIRAGDPLADVPRIWPAAIPASPA